MPGFDNNFTKFNELLPYELIRDGIETSGFSGSTKFKIIHKTDKKVVYDYSRLYGQYGKFAWYPFKHKNTWYAFVGNQYNNAVIINLETSEVISKLDEEYTGGHFCAQGFYVPSIHVDAIPFHTTTERKYKVLYDEKGKWMGTYNEKSEKFNLIDAPIKIDPPQQLLMTIVDSSFDDISEENFNWDNVKFSNMAFMCGVWWAADYEWLVYKIDIEKSIETGGFAPLKENYVFNFDYAQDPDLKMFTKISSQNSFVGEDVNVDQKLTLYYYDMKTLNEKDEDANI